MKKPLKHVSRIGVFAFALLTLVATAGGATVLDSPIITTPDGGGRVYWDSTGNQFWIADIKCDGHGPYFQWDWDANVDDGSRFQNNNGCNTGYFNYLVNVSGHSVIYWKVCNNISGGPDSCASVRSDVT